MTAPATDATPGGGARWQNGQARPWSAESLEALAAAWRAGDKLAVIAGRLGRSPAAVWKKAEAIGLPRRPRARDTDWPAADVATLRAGHAAGLRLAPLAARLGRSPAAVRCKARALGLGFRRGRQPGEAQPRKPVSPRPCMSCGGVVREPAHRLCAACHGLAAGMQYDAAVYA